jgi:hypothetical protein
MARATMDSVEKRTAFAVLIQFTFLRGNVGVPLIICGPDQPITNLKP